MEPIRYPQRCLQHCFGYCAQEKKGTQIGREKDGILYEAAMGGQCDEHWLDCPSYVSNAVANPVVPWLLEKRKAAVDA